MSTDKTGPSPDRAASAASMVAASRMAALLPLAADESLGLDEWWAACEPHWRADPAYLANLEGGRSSRR